MAISDIGEKTAQNITDFFAEEENRALISELFKLGVNQTAHVQEAKQGVISGKKIVVTGKFDTLSREEIISIIEQNGGESVGSVSKKTDYLIVGENAGSKLAKAESLGIQTLTLDAFFDMLNHQEETK